MARKDAYELVDLTDKQVDAERTDDYSDAHLIDSDGMDAERFTKSKQAEVAFADAVGGVRNAVQDVDGDDGGYDVRLADGSTVDVKYTDYDTGRLLVAQYIAQRPRADYYALVIITDDKPDEARLHGFVTADDLQDVSTIEWTHGPTKKFEQTDLRGLDELPDSTRKAAMVVETNATN